MMLGRTLIKVAVILGFPGLLVSCNPEDPKGFQSEHFELVPLAKGVYACIHKTGGEAICNAGIIDNGRETIIFDPFLSPGAALDLTRAVAHLGASPIGYVVNSHAHNDHIRGNQVFGPEVTILSTSRTRELIAEWEPRNLEEEKEYAPQRYRFYDSLFKALEGDPMDSALLDIQTWRPYYKVLAESHLKVRTRLPDSLVGGHTELDGPNLRVRLTNLGPGHTESDLVLYLPEEKILFTGDLVFNACHPYVAHGQPGPWRQWLDSLGGLNPEHVIPGHGKVGDQTLISQMDNYLFSLDSLARTLHQQGIPPDSLGSTPIPEAYSNWWFGRFFQVNLAYLYNLKSTDIAP